MRSFVLLFIFFSFLSCKKDEDTYVVPVRGEDEAFILAIDANTGLYKTNINVKVFDSNMETILREENFRDSLILLSRNESNNLEFSNYEFVFDFTTNNMDSNPLIFEGLDNQSNIITRYLYLDTEASKVEINSEEITIDGEVLKKTYIGYIY